MGASRGLVNYATVRLDAASGAMAAYLARLAGLPLSPLPASRSTGASRRTCCPFSSSVVSVSFLRGGYVCSRGARARARVQVLRSAAENATETRKARRREAQVRSTAAAAAVRSAYDRWEFPSRRRVVIGCARVTPIGRTILGTSAAEYEARRASFSRMCHRKKILVVTDRLRTVARTYAIAEWNVSFRISGASVKDCEIGTRDASRSIFSVRKETGGKN